MLDTILLFGFPAGWEVVLAVALELVIGKFRFFDPVRWLRAACGKLNDAVKKRLNRAARSRDMLVGILSPLLLGAVFLGLGWGLSYLALRLLGVFWASLVRIFLLYCCFDLRRPLWQGMMTLAALKKHDKEKARRTLSHLTRRDTGKMSEQGLIRTAVEEIGTAVSEGGLLPMIFAVFGINIIRSAGSFSVPLAWGAVAAAMFCAPEESPFDPRPAYTRVQTLVGTYFTMIPARLYAVLAMVLGWVLRLDPRAASAELIGGIAGEPAMNRGWLYGVHAGLLGIRLGGGGYYHGCWKPALQIGRDRNVVEACAVRDTLVIGLLTFCFSTVITLFSSLLAVLFALIMSLLAVKNNNNYYGGGYR